MSDLIQKGRDYTSDAFFRPFLLPRWNAQEQDPDSIKHYLPTRIEIRALILALAWLSDLPIEASCEFL